MRALAALVALTACAGALAAGCSSDDITGEPEDIETLVEVVPESSRCVHDREAGEARFEVTLRNTGEDERTVTITPVRRFADRDDVGTTLDGLELTVPGNGEEDGDISVDDVSDDLTACLVRLNDGDPIELELQEAGA